MNSIVLVKYRSRRRTIFFILLDVLPERISHRILVLGSNHEHAFLTFYIVLNIQSFVYDQKLFYNYY